MLRTLPLLTIIILISVGWPYPAAFAADPVAPPSRGVVLEEVGKGSALEKAGLRPGDILLSWECRTGNSTASSGELSIPFDWIYLKTEEALRGSVILSGQREGSDFRLVVPVGDWTGRYHPVLEGALLETYLASRKLIASGALDDGIQGLEKASVLASKTGDQDLLSWFQLILGDELIAAKRNEEARETYQQLAASATNAFPRFLAMEALGDAFTRELRFAEAETSYGQAVLVLPDAKHGLARARIKNKLGNMARQQGRLDDAEKFLHDAFKIRSAVAPRSPILATTLNALGNVAFTRQNLNEAEKYYSESESLWEELTPESLDMATTLNNLGNVALYRNDLDHAEEFYQRALRLREKLAPESAGVAASLNSLGNVAGDRDDLEFAQSLYKKALAIQEKIDPEGPDTAVTLANLGALADRLSDENLAEAYYERALVIQQRIAPMSSNVANILNNLGIVALNRKSWSKAGALFSKALSIQKALFPRSSPVVNSLNNLGLLAAEKGETGTSIRYYQQALKLSEFLSRDNSATVSILSNLGLAEASRHHHAAAERYLSRSLHISEKRNPKSFDTAMSLSYLGVLQFDRGQFDSSLGYERRALAILEKEFPGTTNEADTLHALGMIYTKQHKTEESLQYLDRATRALEAQIGKLGGSQNNASALRASRLDYFQDLIDALLHYGKPEGAFRVLERSRARGLLNLIAERDLMGRGDAADDLRTRQRKIVAQLDKAQHSLLNVDITMPHHGKLTQELQQLRDELDEVVEKIKKESPRYASLRYPQPLDFQEAQAVLEPGTLMLSYSVGAEATHIFVIMPNAPLDVITVPIGQSQWMREVGVFRALIRDSNARAPGFEDKALVSLARRFYANLIQPVEDKVERSSRLVISPDSALHLLPWGALVRDLPSARQYLAEWKPVNIVLSATLYSELRRTREKHASSAVLELAAFGDPRFPQSSVDGSHPEKEDPRLQAAVERGLHLDALPATRTEVQQIASIYSEATRVFLGEEAREENAKSLPRNTRIVHFATHTILDERSPLDSAVVLSIPEKFEEGKDNGLLQAWEIFEQVRLDADLVVLSACESGLGKEMGGEGLIGLTRAFQYAGARSVMASLWKISDRTTAELMVRFYKHLKEGLPKNEALRAAQMELIRGSIQVKNEKGEVEEIDASAPYYWAAFQIYGDWQ